MRERGEPRRRLRGIGHQSKVHAGMSLSPISYSVLLHMAKTVKQYLLRDGQCYYQVPQHPGHLLSIWFFLGVEGELWRHFLGLLSKRITRESIEEAESRDLPHGEGFYQTTSCQGSWQCRVVNWRTRCPSFILPPRLKLQSSVEIIYPRGAGGKFHKVLLFYPLENISDTWIRTTWGSTWTSSGKFNKRLRVLSLAADCFSVQGCRTSTSQYFLMLVEFEIVKRLAWSNLNI